MDRHPDFLGGSLGSFVLDHFHRLVIRMGSFDNWFASDQAFVITDRCHRIIVIFSGIWQLRGRQTTSIAHGSSHVDFYAGHPGTWSAWVGSLHCGTAVESSRIGLWTLAPLIELFCLQ